MCDCVPGYAGRNCDVGTFLPVLTSVLTIGLVYNLLNMMSYDMVTFPLVLK